jgi:hypothetical protein
MRRVVRIVGKDGGAQIASAQMHRTAAAAAGYQTWVRGRPCMPNEREPRTAAAGRALGLRNLPGRYAIAIR